jgi:hypothetical protein
MGIKEELERENVKVKYIIVNFFIISSTIEILVSKYENIVFFLNCIHILFVVSLKM